MFADLHHLHQFMSLDQGGSVTGDSWVGGTNATDANIYFGKLTAACFLHRLLLCN